MKPNSNSICVLNFNQSWSLTVHKTSGEGEREREREYNKQMNVILFDTNKGIVRAVQSWIGQEHEWS